MRSAEDLIARVAAAPASAGLFLDFDGTLAPIVDDPQDSRIPEATAQVIADLAARLKVVAVVSGRPVDFLLHHLELPNVRLLGLYGLQEWGPGGLRVRPEASAAAPRVRRAISRLRAALDGAPGIWVEDKELSVAVHWRNAPDRDAAEREVSLLVASMATESELQPVAGKLVAELRPPVPWDKGAAVRQLAAEQHLAPLLYVGDDIGDLPAFAAAHECGGLAVAVRGGDETPPAVVTSADAVLEGPVETWRWLEALRDAVSADLRPSA